MDRATDCSQSMSLSEKFMKLKQFLLVLERLPDISKGILRNTLDQNGHYFHSLTQRVASKRGHLAHKSVTNLAAWWRQFWRCTWAELRAPREPLAHSWQSLFVAAAHMVEFVGRGPALRHLSIPPKAVRKWLKHIAPSKLLWRRTLPCREADWVWEGYLVSNSWLLSLPSQLPASVLDGKESKYQQSVSFEKQYVIV